MLDTPPSPISGALSIWTCLKISDTIVKISKSAKNTFLYKPVSFWEKCNIFEEAECYLENRIYYHFNKIGKLRLLIKGILVVVPQDLAKFGTFESLLFDEKQVLIITMENFWPVVWNDFIINRLFKITIMKYLLDFACVRKCHSYWIGVKLVYETFLFFKLTMVPNDLLKSHRQLAYLRWHRIP